VRTQVWAPDPDRGDIGEIAEGFYTIEGGVLRVVDLEDRPVGIDVLKPGQDADAIARELLRKKRRATAFYDPIRYPPSGLV
jgi:hypothetical protein